MFQHTVEQIMQNFSLGTNLYHHTIGTRPYFDVTGIDY
jgi:hypothetical protein